MNKQLQIIFLLLSTLSYHAMAQETIINGKFSSMKDGTVIYLSNDKQVTDSTLIVNGAFSLKTSLKKGEFYSLSAVAGPQSVANVTLYLEPGVLNISGKNAMLENLNFSGSRYADDMTSFYALPLQPVFKKKDLLMQRYSKVSRSADTTGRKQLADSVKILKEAINVVYDNWIYGHSASPVSAYAIWLNYNLNGSTRLEQLLNSLKMSAKDNSIGRELQQTVDVGKLTAIGQMAPEFTQNDTSGRPLSLKQFRGKYVLIDFWASWCGPCRAENPKIVKLFQKFKDKEFTILGVSLDREGDKDKWLKAIHDDGLTWNHVSDLKWWKNEVATLYGIRSVPSSLLIDPQGRIIAKNLRSAELENRLLKLLK